MSGQSAESDKLVGREAAEFKRITVADFMVRYGMPPEEAEKAVNIWILAVNETAREAGEDIPCLEILHL